MEYENHSFKRKIKQASQKECAQLSLSLSYFGSYKAREVAEQN